MFSVLLQSRWEHDDIICLISCNPAVVNPAITQLHLLPSYSSKQVASWLHTHSSAPAIDRQPLFDQSGLKPSQWLSSTVRTNAASHPSPSGLMISPCKVLMADLSSLKGENSSSLLRWGCSQLWLSSPCLCPPDGRHGGRHHRPEWRLQDPQEEPEALHLCHSHLHLPLRHALRHQCQCTVTSPMVWPRNLLCCWFGTSWCLLSKRCWHERAHALIGRSFFLKVFNGHIQLVEMTLKLCVTSTI